MHDEHSIARRFRACAGLVFIGLTTLCAQAASPMRVLILNPYSRDTEPFTAVVSAFRSTLGKEIRKPVAFDEVPLDLAHFTEEEGEEPLVAFLAERIKRQPVDLVVPVGGASVRFVDRHREHLFPTTPILAVAAEPRMIPPGFLEKNATLVTQKIDLPGMVEDMLQMQPDTKQIAVVFGSSPLERVWVEQCRKEFSNFEGRVNFIWLNDLPLDKVIERCASLPPRSFIFHGLFLVDADGISSEKNEALQRIHQAANAPIFACFESEFGKGPVGGRLFLNSRLGTEAAKTAAAILKGKPPSEIPPVYLDSLTATYDWRELQRWDIPENNLPAGSVIQFREAGFWARYRWPILGVALVALTQSALIVGLLIHRKRRMQAEAEANLIADISSKFVNLPASEVDREIMDAERRICELLDLDVAGLWQWTDEPEPSLTLTHLHGEVKMQPPENMKAADFFPWFQKELTAGRAVGFSSLAELQGESARDRESFRAFGIQSCLTLPLSVGGERPIGAFGLNATRRERAWPESQIARMQMIAQIFTNALARKRTDHALRESEMRLSLAADAADAGLWVLDWERQSFWITDQAREIFGYPKELVLDMANFGKSIHPDDLGLIHQTIAHSVSTGDPLNIEYRIRRTDGEERWVASHGRPFFKTNGDPERLLGLSMDITGRKVSEGKIRADEARLAAGFDLAGLGYYEFDFARDTCFIDHRLSRICDLPTGHHQAAPVLQRWMDMVHRDDLDLVQSENGKLLSAAADRISLHHRYTHPADGIRWLHHFSGVAHRSPQGEMLRTYGVIRDITVQRRAELEAADLRNALAHSGRVSVLGQLSSALAHELSQPLGAILRNAEAAEIMLREPTPDLEEIRAIVDDILVDDQRAAKVIDRLRSLLKKGHLDVQLLILPDLIDEVLSLVHSDAVIRQVRIRWSPEMSLPLVLGDRVHLQQVLLNLLVNAMDALENRPTDERDIELQARRIDAATVEVRVCDSGPGIPEDTLGRLFEPFFTTKEKGMGMGLPVSKTIIEAHHGKLWAENNPDRGACFCFTLPAENNPILP